MTAGADTIRVLYVDDEPEVAGAIGEAFDSEDHSIAVQTAGSVEEGLETLAADEVDCVVSAYDVPERDGVAFLEAVREEYPDLPFILYTDAGSEVVASEAISAGVTDYLRREPGTNRFATLAGRIRDAVSGQRPGTGTGQGRFEEITALHEALFENSPDMIHVHDAAGNVIDPNARLCEETGYSHGELTDMKVWELDRAIDPEEAADRWERMDPGDRERVEGVYSRRDGSTFPVDVHVRRLDLADGDRFVAICRDVSERRERERVLRDVYDVISDRNQSFDEQVRALLEIGRAELDTQYGTLSEIRGDDYVFDVVAADDDSIQEGDVVPVSATNCEIAASTEQTLVLGDVERDAPGETDRAGFTDWGISCYLGAPVFVDEDVRGTFCFYDTEPREGQFSEWEVTLVDLMSRWVSHELGRRQANERLQEQNEQLERFVSIVSHDLRNPLSVAGGRLDLAAEECDSEHLDHVARAHDRMEALIDDLLTLAREGEQVGETELVDIGELAENCWLNVETPGAAVVTEADLTIRADRSRLQQLLENLMRNAIEHGSTSPRSSSEDAVEYGDETVTVTVGELEGGFYVEDDGPGIPEEDREEVFEPGHSTAEDGTGFGLGIVEQVVDAHGWEIRLTEGEDGGARFEITGVTIEG